MPESKKIETNFIANMEAAEKIPANQRLTATVKHPSTPHTVFEIYALIPTSDEESIARYDCELKDLIEMGCRQITYRPNYKDVMFVDEAKTQAKSDDIIHSEIQNLLDGYQVGRKAAATGGVKAKAQKLDKLASIAAERGYTVDELDGILAKLKTKK